MSRTIHITGASEKLRLRLESSAKRNCRTLNQEALARLEFTFDIEDALLTKAHQQLVDEAFTGILRHGNIERLKRRVAQLRARQ
jgi:hypothetical protein